MSRTRVVHVVLTALLMLTFVGCAPAEEPDPGPQAKVTPPVIGTEGVLRVGIDLDHPPFAGVDKGREAGIDVDVASAIAGELGLELELVEVEPGGAVQALEAGVVDVVMSAVLSQDTVVDLTFAGFYATTGPSLFASDEVTVTPGRLGGLRIAVQEGSEAYWNLVYELGEDRLVVVPTLREAFDLLDASEVDVVAGDAFVSAYMARDYEGVGFSAQLGTATQVGVAVASEATELSGVIRDALDTLATGGVLDTIRTKWVGELPELEGVSVEDE